MTQFLFTLFPPFLITDHRVSTQEGLYRKMLFFQSIAMLMLFLHNNNCYHGSCIYYIHLSKIKKHSKNYFSINIMQWIWFIFLKCSIWTGGKKKKKKESVSHSIQHCFHRKMHIWKSAYFFDLLIVAERPRLYWQLHRSMRRVIIPH